MSVAEKGTLKSAVLLGSLGCLQWRWVAPLCVAKPSKRSGRTLGLSSGQRRKKRTVSGRQSAGEEEARVLCAEGRE